ncbi:PSD1 and planctomycete cytochrome C domain-containing protein [Urbifossiella limnaea]|uniref:Planctomycete cytochrome C n=1 Tax=Urbifossiella limnaea TaxID=2528023 RepID=A0A517Y1M8_9BACT|nr:PSD1 and planctomycete cytochrome C domain-containing protein [Urbifossiella limnaea]QDU23653.1 Planctomycete cytochrome C [Urbifossiella limnaea]
MPRLAAALVLALLPAAARADDAFESKVRPVLAEHCYACHSAAAKKAKGGLTLDTPDGIRKGGDSGPAVVPKDATSLLLKAVEYHPDAPAMPPKGKLPDRAVADLRSWVKAGAVLPEGRAAQAGPTTRDPAAAKQFWSFRPLREQPLPAVSRPDWPARRHDHFVLAKLDTLMLRPAAPADRRTLVRRVYFDLIGLPPTFEQVEAFVADGRPDAYERLVDGLLASPRFGEKWARHWLDVARYAEDHSTSESTCKPPRFPFRYRDWVVAALNADLPFDDFVRRQLAADLLPGLAPEELAALGFLGLSPVYHKEPKLAEDVIAGIVADEWDERVDAVTRGFLGLTVACARCHDHKFDPVSSEDYYALAGVMASTQLAERPLIADPDAVTEELAAVRLGLMESGMRAGYARELRGTAAKEGRDPAPFDRDARKYDAEMAALKEREKKLYTGPVTPAVRDAGTWVTADGGAWTSLTYKAGVPRDLPVFVRGNPMKPGPAPVPRRFLRVLSAGEPAPFRSGSGRRELAEAIVTDARGLTARVFVNRVWGWVVGRPLVATPSNFGALGEPPSHPELLDDLAARFVASGWSVKWLVRELVLSAAYRQASRADDESAARDADNRWLWRGHRKRLEVEGWRDAMLQVSGRLDLRGGGPSDDLDGPFAVRRTVYGKVSRQRAADVHRLFDLPDPKAHGERREPTVTPLQQLYFLNSPFVRGAAVGVARLAARDASSPRDVMRQLYRRVLLRGPTAAETAAGLALAGEPAAWDVLAQALLVSNEFLFLD